MSWTKLHRRWLIILVTTLLLGSIPSAHAQTQVDFRLSPPVIDSFPTVSLYLSVFDENGNPITDLDRSNFILLEDETAIDEFELNETMVGTDQIFVINTSYQLDVRDSQGTSRFDKIRDALLEWWADPQAAQLDVDTLSLVTYEGVLVEDSPASATLASTLDELEPEFSDEELGFDLLLSALELTHDPTSASRQPRIALFFTSLLPLSSDLPIATLVSRAQETNTAIYPILYGTVEDSEQPEASGMRLLAEATGGRFILFDPQAGLTDLMDQILAQRTRYQLTYTSQINTSGEHQLRVRFSQGELEAISEPMAYEIVVQPPEIAFVEPPARITRASEDSSLPLALLPPTNRELQILVTFPDGHPRPLRVSRLFVDEELVIEKLNPPFDTFDWDLSNYTSSQEHTLQVVVEDVLGLQATSIRVPISIQVVPPARGLSALGPALNSLLIVVGVMVLGLVLAGVLYGYSRRSTPAETAKPERENLPTSLRSRLHRTPPEEPADAFLVPISTHLGEDVIPLTGADLVLGSDPSLTAAPLDDPSVSRLHARLIRLAAGSYQLRDQGSVAGTWVNYQQVPEEGQILEQGDLIHIGRSAFRFRLAQEPPEPEIRLRPTGPEATITTDRSESNGESDR
jgi:hypothetical protein